MISLAGIPGKKCYKKSRADLHGFFYALCPPHRPGFKCGPERRCDGARCPGLFERRFKKFLRAILRRCDVAGKGDGSKVGELKPDVYQVSFHTSKVPILFNIFGRISAEKVKQKPGAVLLRRPATIMNFHKFNQKKRPPLGG